MIFCRRHRGRCLLFFLLCTYYIKEDALYFSAEVPQRAEGERPELCDRQRWEAVFRRERRPESLDRFL